MISILRQIAKKNQNLRKFFGYYLASSGLFDVIFNLYPLSDFWKNRISNVVKSDDNFYIDRVEGAGKIKNGRQIMHNGLKIYLGSYYGPEVAKMLKENKGVHEPQEERVFSEVLKKLKPGATMVELGAFWSFYSMWFNKEIENAKNYMVEGDDYNLGCGKRNFKLNGMTGKFIHANIGEFDNEKLSTPQICIKTLVARENISYIDILHSDIQGYELEMLRGATSIFENNMVGFIFISTHSQELHEECRNYLIQWGYEIIADADLSETFSEDGLLVAKSKEQKIDKIYLSKNNF
jgi:hypothetical protein